MRRIIYALAFALICFSIATGKSTNRIRHSVIQLRGVMGGMCTGVEVVAPSGKVYTLTAGHCTALVREGSMIAKTEDGAVSHIQVVAEDPTSDLLLLEAVASPRPLDVAGKISRFQHLRLFSHGNGYKTWESDGHVIDETPIAAPIFSIKDQRDWIHCLSEPKYSPSGDLLNVECVLTPEEVATSITATPGSSGGPVVNDRGDLVGICSAISPPFTFQVKLTDITKFLAKY